MSQRRAMKPSAHGDPLPAELFCRRFGIQNVIINYVGAVIGSHTGAGVVALFFVGEKR